MRAGGHHVGDAGQVDATAAVGIYGLLGSGRSEFVEALFGLGKDGEAEHVIVPIGPVAELFRTAWQRVESGDAPAYEELKTKGRR